jgi:hypothetical protein
MIKDCISGICASALLFGMIGMFAYAIHQDCVRDDQRAVETTKQWNAWVGWRDQNCRISEWMVGLSESSGKFHQNDNATVYDCGGVKYVVADSVERAAKDKSLDFSQIPKFSDKK